MSPEILEMHVFVHYNWQYEFMRPSIAEIVEAYLKIYGPEARVEDLEDESDSEDGDGSDDEAEEEGNGIAPAAAPAATQ